MSELQDYYDNFRQGYWADPDEKTCLCHGSGWALSELDTWHECPCHFKNQPHPEAYECPECGDGKNFAPIDCSRCGKALKEELNEFKDFPEPSEEIPSKHEREDEIPF